MFVSVNLSLILGLCYPCMSTRICSFDIENMYRNIPKIDIINVINNILENNTEIHLNIRNEIIYIYIFTESIDGKVLLPI
jgi:hypothetical protein